MPLLDHFHPPISQRQPWVSFHARWAVEIADLLNRTLPRRYAAEVQIHLGRQAEADVAEYDRGFPDENGHAANEVGGGGVALQVQPYTPPAALTMTAMFPDDIEVHVNDMGVGGAQLIAVVELVSPSNKDRLASRRAFAIKTAAYLQRGIGVVILDIVTEKHFNLHDELIRLVQQADLHFMPPDTHTYASAYRPARRGDVNQIDLWTFPLAVGQPLPVVPLALRATTTVPLDLETTYTTVCRNSRLD